MEIKEVLYFLLFVKLPRKIVSWDTEFYTFLMCLQSQKMAS